MATTPARDEAPLRADGASIWLDGTGHGPLSSSVLRWDGDLVAVDPPILGGERVRLEPGRKVRLGYRSKDVPCAVPAVVEDLPGEDDVEWCRRTGPVMRFQRRLDFRVRDALHARLWMVDPTGGDDAPIEGVTNDLSARGVLVRAPLRPRPGDVARLELQLPGGDVLTAEGRCLRVEDAGAEAGRWDIAFALDVGEVEEQVLRAAVMLLQRRALAKGLEA